MTVRVFCVYDLQEHLWKVQIKVLSSHANSALEAWNCHIISIPVVLRWLTSTAIYVQYTSLYYLEEIYLHGLYVHIPNSRKDSQNMVVTFACEGMGSVLITTEVFKQL